MEPYFADLLRCNARYSLGAAHVLVLSRSSFSYSAALYNENLVVYTPFWHAPLPSWVVHDGTQQQLERALNTSLALGRLEHKLRHSAAPPRTAPPREHDQGSMFTLDLA